MRVIFMGSPDFAVPALNALHQHHDIVAVYCQPPRPAGRGKTPRPTPVHARAETLGLAVRHPVSLRNSEVVQDFAALGADVAIVVAYGLILPQAVLDAPRLGCLNIHASLLPRWRGAAPIHRAIMSGDVDTGISIMRMEAGLDTGPVLAQESMTIGPEETTAELHDRLAFLGSQMIVRILDSPLTNAVPQPSDGVIYATKIDKSEARIDWARPAPEVDRLIRGLSPFPGAWCEVSGERVKLLRSRLAIGEGRPGTVLDKMTVACGTGAIEITLAQREGKRAMEMDEFLRGFTLPKVLS